MKSRLFFLFACSILTLLSYSQNFKWAIGSGSSQFDYSTDIKTDISGNIFMTGIFSGSMNFDSAGITKTLNTTGSRDLFLVKYNCKRVYQWAIRVGGTSNEGGSFAQIRIKTDNSSNVYFTGTFLTTATFTSTNGISQNKTSNGAEDMFFAKYNTNGVLQWVVQAGGTGSDESGDVSIDNSGNPYFTGIFSSTCTFNTITGLPANLISAGSQDMFIAKYDINGNRQWINSAGGAAQDIGVSLSVSNTGDVYVSGNYSCCVGGTCSFGTITISNTSSWGAYLAKANNSGNWLWVNCLGAAAAEAGSDVLVDNLGQVYFLGHFNGSTSISSQSPGSSTSISTNGLFDVFLGCFDLNGVVVWTRTFGGTGNDYGWNLTYDPLSTSIIAVGDFSTSVNFGPTTKSSSGNTDVYITWINRNTGIVQKVVTGGGTGIEDAFACDLTIDNKVLVSGLFQNTATFNPYSITTYGAEDAFMAKIGAENLLINSNKISICGNDSALLYTLNNNSFSYQWYRNSIPIAPSNNDSIYVKSAGTYKLIITNNCNEVDTSNNITISVVPLTLTINASPGQNICSGDSVRLIATSVGATTFSWTPAATLSNPIISNPYAKPLTTTKYYLTASNASCSVNDSIQITVLPALTVNAGSDQTICFRDSIQLNAISVGATSFLWSPVTGLSNSAIATPFAKPIVNTNYIVTASNGSCTAKDTILITINNVQVNAGTDQTICLGDSVQLNASSVSTGTYLWSPVTDLSDPNISNPKAKPGSLTQYIVSLTSGLCVAKDTVQINTANIILNAGTDKVVCLGDSIKLNATCTGSTNFLWSPSVILDNSNIIQPWAKPPATINLIITATNGLCVKKDTVNLSVVSRPAVSAGLDKTICPGDSVQLITTNTGAISFAWSPKTGLSDSTISDPFAKPINSTNYILKVSNGICTSSDTVKVNIINPLSVNAGNDRTICKGDTVHLYASPNGASSYNWSPATGLSNSSIQSPVAMPAVSTLYKVIVANGSCTSTDSVFITVTDLHANAGPDLFICKKELIMVYGSGNGTGFSWNPNLFIINNTSATPVINPDTSLSYILTVTNGICTDRDTMTAFVTSIDAAIINPDTAICNGDSVQLRSFINGDAFYWSPKLFISDTAAPFPFVYPNVKTKYFLTTTRGTCIKKDSITIDLSTLLFTGGAGNDTMVCKGNSLQLKANVLPGAKYLWSPTTYLNDSGISNPIAIPNATTQYILKIQTGKNCIAFDTILIHVNPVPVVDAGPDQNICDENYATIGFFSNLADSFMWSPQSGLSDAGILQTQASPGINSVYIIKAMNKLTGCFSMDTVNVSYIKPKALFSATPVFGNLPLPVQFYNNSSALADSFYWDFGDTISTSTARDPSHIYKKEGIYKVKLIAINKLGCYDTAEITITVIGGLIVFVPNVFTPNNDGLNEEFIISYNKDALLFLKGSIWNRWGAKVYDFEMPNGKWWNGKSDEEDCADGVYFYMFEAGDLTGKTEQFHGTLTLLR